MIWRSEWMSLLILKGICVIGIILNLFLMLRKTRKRRTGRAKNKIIGMSGEEQWQEQKLHAIPSAIIGFTACFLDALGIGSFALTSIGFKLTKSVDDVLVPGTLHVGTAIPVCVEAFLFFDTVEMDLLTLALMVAASIAGAALMADIVSTFNRKEARCALFIGLFLLASVTLMKDLGFGPFGALGYATSLRGARLVIAVAGNFILGALMSIGVGLYAPCMALVLALGMDVTRAFPAMMGSYAFLMAFGSSPTFIARGRYDMFASLMLAIFGTAGVCAAYAFVKYLPLGLLTKIIACVVYLTAFLYLRDAVKKGSAA